MNLTHLMFDIETLGHEDRIVIASIAVVPFKFEQPRMSNQSEAERVYNDLILGGCFVKFSIPEQIKVFQRSVDPETVAWWKAQSIEARQYSVLPSDEDVGFIEGLETIARFIKASGYDYKKSYVWSRGSHFDFPKMEHAFKQAGLTIPYNGWMIRDSRTYFDCLAGTTNGKWPGEYEKPSNFVAHHALHDAGLEAFRMMELYQLLQGEENE